MNETITIQKTVLDGIERILVAIIRRKEHYCKCPPVGMGSAHDICTHCRIRELINDLQKVKGESHD